MEALPRIVVWVISVFDPRQLGHEIRPLDQAAIRHSDFETLKILSLPKSTIGRRRSLLKTASIDPIGYSVSEMDPVLLRAFSPCLSTCGLFQALSGHVLRARRSPMLIGHRVARQATG